MKITIITPTYNSGKTIANTIESIIAQNYPDLEYIIVDGASTDTTKDIISNYKDKLNITLISEPDAGIYDAMNKGVKMATGEIVGILNSDDFFYNAEVLSIINAAFESDDSVDAVYGDLAYVDRNDTSKQTRFWEAGEYQEENLNDGWIIPHPTFFMKKEVYQKMEKIFNTDFKIAADYELLLRLLKIQKIHVAYIPQTLVTMREGGTSASGLSQRMRGWKELRRAWKVNSLPLPKFFILRRVTKKLTQFFKK
jgi:glycosyltransferase involved in cell wall biosynthesis